MSNSSAQPKPGGWERTRAAVVSLDRGLAFAELTLIATFITLAAVLNFAPVVARYVLNLSASKLEEISVYLVVWVIFIGAAHADRIGQHISLDLVYSVISDRWRKRLWRVADFLLALTAFVLAYRSFEAVMFSKMIGETSVSTLAAPIWIIMSVMPAAFLMIAVRSLVRTIAGRQKLNIFDEVEG